LQTWHATNVSHVTDYNPTEPPIMLQVSQIRAHQEELSCRTGCPTNNIQRDIWSFRATTSSMEGYW